ncbi:unnamed protein product [Ophioblennius macclurei]
MSRILVQLLAVAFCLAMVNALRCYKCRFGIGDLCITTETTCGSGEHCFSGEGTAVGVVSIQMKGCLAASKCNHTSMETFPSSISNSTVYSMTKTCCTSDLCNAAPGLPGAAGLSLALASVASLLVANMVV